MRVAVLLAAGASRRMGRPKLELELAGRTLIERSVQNLLDASVDRVRLVIPHVRPAPALASMKDLDVIRNPESAGDLASSLRAGLRGLPETTRVLLVALADKPLVKPETIKKLLDVFEEGDAKVVYPVYRGEQGHPVLWDAALVDELSRLEGDRGAKSMLEAHRGEALAVPVDDVGVCFDIDTPEDYQAALELL